MKDDERWVSAIAQELERRMRGEIPLPLCKHENAKLGILLTPTGFQGFELCRNLACGNVLSEPLDTEDISLGEIYRHEATLIGDLRRTRDRCVFLGCTAIDLEQHHIAPWEWFGPAAEMFGTVTICPEHHRLIHKGLRTGRWSA